jgi:hypothetical protein
MRQLPKETWAEIVTLYRLMVDLLHILRPCYQIKVVASEWALITCETIPAGQGRELLDILTGLASFKGGALRLTMVNG